MTALENMVLFRSGLVFTLAGTMCCFTAAAQRDTLDLTGVEISAPGPDREMAGVEVERFPLQASVGGASSNIGSFLGRHTDLDLRSYGPGGSVLLSMRGSSTSQVQVSINGIPFEMPSLAMTDLSVLPVAAFGQLTLYRGSAAAYLGNAAVGGGVMLDSRRGYENPGVTQTFTAGQFGAFGSVTSLGIGDEKFSAHTTLYSRRAKNDFYRPDPYAPHTEIRQQNATQSSRGWAQGFNFTVGNTRIGTFLWADMTDREIPASRSRVESDASQSDRNMRAQVSSLTDLGNTLLEAAVSYDQGVLNFRDPAGEIDDHSSFSAAHMRLKATAQWNMVDAYLIVDMRDARAQTATYDKAKQRTTPALIGGLYSRLFGSRTRASAVLRQEWLNGRPLPLLPVLGVEHSFGKMLSLSASLGKTYRLPGLNDLFWNPGGNPDLKPESGWFQEASIHVDGRDTPFPFRLSATGFHRLIDDWIMWRPGPGYWSPVNLQSVRSRGLEGSASIARKMGSTYLSQELSGTYVLSVNRESAFAGDRSVGLQLPYVPRLSAVSRTSLSVGDRWNATLPIRFTDRRYTASDHAQFLDAYWLIDFELEYRAEIASAGATVTGFGAVRNAFDTEYQIQNSHYMPGRYFEFGLRLNFQFNPQNP